MKKIILSSILLLAGLAAGYAQEKEADVKPSFWKDTYVQVADGGALDLTTGVGNTFELSAGKMFTKCVGASLSYTNVYIFDDSRSFMDHMLGAGFVWSFLGNVDTDSWKPVFIPEIGLMVSGRDSQSSPALPYIANSLANYFRIHKNVDLVLNAKLYTSLDPQNQGKVAFISMPTACLTLGARYRF
ncbi:MAG: hypothetical protein J5769_06260 [Bacteroidales bacterium]|nr:hypothetical protein [Bacteroidales bacterium]